MSNGTEHVGFGGGCHWCTEAVFQSLIGVESVAQGFVRSEPPYDTWSEAVVVTFDPSMMELAVLIEIHLRTHSSMSNHTMRAKYRSAVYTFTDRQKMQAENVLTTLQPTFQRILVTLVLPHCAFRYSEQRFQNYYSKYPERAFCQTYIDPKLRLLREEYSNRMRVL